MGCESNPVKSHDGDAINGYGNLDTPHIHIHPQCEWWEFWCKETTINCGLNQSINSEDCE